jgi:hypothetical protein
VHHARPATVLPTARRRAAREAPPAPHAPRSPAAAP